MRAEMRAEMRQLVRYLRVQAVRRARVSVGMRVLITGAGPIGLLCALAARSAGATTVAMSDLVESKLLLARTVVSD